MKSQSDAPATVSVEWGEQTFTVPAQSAWPVDVWEALEDGRMVSALRGMLGPAQWKAFKATRPAPVLADMSVLADRIAKACGWESAGESPASSS